MKRTLSLLALAAASTLAVSMPMPVEQFFGSIGTCYTPARISVAPECTTGTDAGCYVDWASADSSFEVDFIRVMERGKTFSVYYSTTFDPFVPWNGNALDYVDQSPWNCSDRRNTASDYDCGRMTATITDAWQGSTHLGASEFYETSADNERGEVDGTLGYIGWGGVYLVAVGSDQFPLSQTGTMSVKFLQTRTHWDSLWVHYHCNVQNGSDVENFVEKFLVHVVNP